jgi:hypothetical protein
MNFDLQTLLPDLEALTPEGRWNMLQSWLKENPEYGDRAERWSTQTVEEVFDELLVLASKRHGAFAAIAFGLPAIAAKIRSAIKVFQACYRERANEHNHSHVPKSTPRRRKGKLHAKTTKTN